MATKPRATQIQEALQAILTAHVNDALTILGQPLLAPEAFAPVAVGPIGGDTLCLLWTGTQRERQHTTTAFVDALVQFDLLVWAFATDNLAVSARAEGLDTAICATLDDPRFRYLGGLLEQGRPQPIEIGSARVVDLGEDQSQMVLPFVIPLVCPVRIPRPEIKLP